MYIQTSVQVARVLHSTTTNTYQFQINDRNFAQLLYSSNSQISIELKYYIWPTSDSHNHKLLDQIWAVALNPGRGRAGNKNLILCCCCLPSSISQRSQGWELHEAAKTQILSPPIFRVGLTVTSNFGMQRERAVWHAHNIFGSCSMLCRYHTPVYLKIAKIFISWIWRGLCTFPLGVPC